MIDLVALRAAAEAATIEKWDDDGPPRGFTCDCQLSDQAWAYIALANPKAILALIDAYERLYGAAKGWYDVMDFQGDQAKRLRAALSEPQEASSSLPLGASIP